MFTGIVERVGRVGRLARGSGSARIEIDCPGFPVLVGDSVCVDGACLTVVEPSSRGFRADLSAETLRRSSLGELKPGAPVNLERALVIGSRLGGHFVLGHVDGRGQVQALRRNGAGGTLVVRYPAGYHELVVEKGSVAIRGVSLTIARSSRRSLEVALVPYTLEGTNLGGLRAGDTVNLEFDYLAKLVARVSREVLRTRGQGGGGKDAFRDD